MYLKDFCVDFNVPSHTVRTYIKRNEKLFEGHVQKRERMLWLDDVAVQLLNRKYGYGSSESELVTYDDELAALKDKLIETQELVTKLQQAMLEVQPKLLIAEHHREKNTELEKENEQLKEELKEYSSKIISQSEAKDEGRTEVSNELSQMSWIEFIRWKKRQKA